MAPRRPKRQQKRSATDTQGGGNENEKENSASNANNKKKCTDAAKKKTNRPSSQAPSKTTDGSTVKDAGGNGVKDQRPEWLQRGEQGARGANDKDSTATRGAWPPAQPPALPYAPPADGNKTQTTDDGRNPKAAATNTNVGDDGNIPLGSEWGGNPSTVSDASVVNMETATTTSNNDNASISSMSVVSTTTCYKSRATKNLNVSDTSKKVFTRTDLYRAEKFMTNPEKHLSDAKPKNAKDKETGVVYRKLVQYMRNINALKPTETYRVSEADKSLIISCLNQKRGETTTEVKNGITAMFVERGTSFDPIAVADAKRANPEEYFKFCVNGGLRKSLQARFRDGWDQQGVTGTFVFENKVSVSDEAFFLVLIENNGPRWQKLYDIRDQLSVLNDITDAVVKKETRARILKDNNVPQPRWTNRENTRRNKGWATAGIVRYKALKKLVKEDRLKNGAAFNAWIRKYYTDKHGAQLEANARAAEAATENEKDDDDISMDFTDWDDGVDAVACAAMPPPQNVVVDGGHDGVDEVARAAMPPPQNVVVDGGQGPV